MHHRYLLYRHHYAPVYPTHAIRERPVKIHLKVLDVEPAQLDIRVMVEHANQYLVVQNHHVIQVD